MVFITSFYPLFIASLPNTRDSWRQDYTSEFVVLLSGTNAFHKLLECKMQRELFLRRVLGWIRKGGKLTEKGKGGQLAKLTVPTSASMCNWPIGATQCTLVIYGIVYVASSLIGGLFDHTHLLQTSEWIDGTEAYKLSYFQLAWAVSQLQCALFLGWNDLPWGSGNVLMCNTLLLVSNGLEKKHIKICLEKRHIARTHNSNGWLGN